LLALEVVFLLKGKLKTRTYTDKAGEKRYITERICEGLLVLDKPEGPPPMPIVT
jgi:single-stranded DNA-binding protein